MAAISRNCTVLAPDRSRERKTPSGSNGVAAVASRTTKPASSSTASGPNTSVAVAPQPICSACTTV